MEESESEDTLEETRGTFSEKEREELEELEQLVESSKRQTKSRKNNEDQPVRETDDEMTEDDW